MLHAPLRWAHGASAFNDRGLRMNPRTRFARWLKIVVAATVLALATAVGIQAVSSYEFATPIFKLDVAPDGSVVVADAGAGIVELRHGVGSLMAELEAVTDVATVGRSDMFAVRGGGPGLTTGALFRVSRGSTRLIADLYQFEAENNPHPTAVDSNPFDVELLNGGDVLVADAGGNDVLIVDQNGGVDWIAVFPNELVSTANIKSLAGCPTPVPELAFACALPPSLPAQPVSTSVAVGPDGAYYVSELKGFPAPTGSSRIWRVEPGTRHADCATSPACSVVATGFTSVVDLTFGPNGTLYVVEIDEASWAAVEFGIGSLGGTVNACDPATWACSQVATGLPMPVGAAVDRRTGEVYVTVNTLVPGAAEVIKVP
jgi:hypothetical protein